MEYYFEGKLKKLIIKDDKYMAAFDSDFYGKSIDTKDIMLVREESDNKFVQLVDLITCNENQFKLLENNKNKKFKINYKVDEQKEQSIGKITKVELIL